MEASNTPQPRSPHPVVRTPELVRLILQDLSLVDSRRRGLVSATRVSKMWSEHACDILWENVMTMWALLPLIAPLESVGSLPVSDASPRLWDRFARYAHRVRALYCFDLAMVRESVFQEIILNQPSLYLLPNLRILECCQASSPEELQNVATLFIQPTLQKLSFTTPSLTSRITSTDIAIFLQRIETRAPNLMSFSWDNGEEPPETLIEDPALVRPLTALLSRLEKLRRITIPATYLTEDVFSALSNLKHLQSITAGDFVGALGAWPLDSPASRSDEPPRFPSLQELALDISFSELMNLKTWPRPFSNLTILTVMTPLVETSASMGRLFQMLSATCKSLSSLHISSYVDPLLRLSPSESAITAESMKRLTQVPLQYLCLYGPTPPQVNNEELDLLLSHWPNLIEFCLGVDGEGPPRVYNTASLTLDVLPIIARRCPQLRALILHLNGVTSPSLAIDADPPVEDTFQNLDYLDVQHSPIDARFPDVPAMFMSKILPVGCRVGFSELSGHEVHSVIAMNLSWVDISQRSQAWRAVATLVAAMGARTAKLAKRVKELEQEVDALKLAANASGSSMGE